MPTHRTVFIIRIINRTPHSQCPFLALGLLLEPGQGGVPQFRVRGKTRSLLRGSHRKCGSTLWVLPGQIGQQSVSGEERKLLMGRHRSLFEIAYLPIVMRNIPSKPTSQILCPLAGSFRVFPERRSTSVRFQRHNGIRVRVGLPRRRYRHRSL